MAREKEDDGAIFDPFKAWQYLWPNDHVYWVGAQNDLPLVDSGISQAQKLANALSAHKLHPEAIFCGPLQRTSQYADIVRTSLDPHIPIHTDMRLNELDYGQWSGLNDEEITKRFGKDDLANWNSKGLWPKNGNWGSSDSQVLNETKTFIEHLLATFAERSTLLAVTSNGRLRYFLRLFPNIYADYCQRNMLKVGTGKVCLLFKNEDVMQPICWNAEPDQALSLTSDLEIKN